MAGLVRWEDINGGVNWGVVLLYAAAISLGLQMKETGAAEWLARSFIHALTPFGMGRGPGLAFAVALLTTLYGAVEKAVKRGDDLKASYAAVRAVMDRPFGDYAIYEHCLPFNVSRAYDEARGIDHPVVWTDVRGDGAGRPK